MLTCICICDLSAFGEAKSSRVETRLVPKLEAVEAYVAHCTTFLGCALHATEKRWNPDRFFKTSELKVAQ